MSLQSRKEDLRNYEKKARKKQKDIYTTITTTATTLLLQLLLQEKEKCSVPNKRLFGFWIESHSPQPPTPDAAIIFT